MTKRVQPCVKPVRTLGAVALVAQVFLFQACGGSNGPGVGASGGATGSGGRATGTAGATGSGSGGTGTGGNPGTAGMTVAFGEPACASTVVKLGACAPTDQQFCYKTCGPARTGVKSEMCQTSGTYAEMSGCTFDPSKDYSCYKIPTAANAACPAGMTPMGSADCTMLNVPACTLCNSMGGLVGGQYLDSTGSPKPGWCTCQAPNTAGIRTWTCASDTAWPCPLGSGC